MRDYFIIEALDSAFDRDSRATSHPLFFEIRKAEDVSEAFDSITYSKGASVLRMIRSVMGEESFKNGLNVRFEIFNLVLFLGYSSIVIRAVRHGVLALILADFWRLACF